MIPGEWLVAWGADTYKRTPIEEIADYDGPRDVCVLSNKSREVAVSIDFNQAGYFGGHARLGLVSDASDLDLIKKMADLAIEHFDMVYGFLYESGYFDVAYSVDSGVKDGLRDIYPLNFYGPELCDLFKHRLRELSTQRAEISTGEKGVWVSFLAAYSVQDFGRIDRRVLCDTLGDQYFIPGCPIIPMRNKQQGQSGRIGLWGLLKLLMSSPRKNESASVHL